MKIERTEIFGYMAGLRGMRNAGESWAKSDSYSCSTQRVVDIYAPELIIIGPNDLKLACKLIKAGYFDDSAAEANRGENKFLRFIEIWVDFVLSLAIWAELDTYCVGKVRNSCSTMYKLGTRDLTPDDFQDRRIAPEWLVHLNEMCAKYRSTQGAEHVQILHDLKMDLPSGYLLRSTYHCSYETVLKMYFERRNHRMKEWSGKGGICEWIASLPYMEQFIEAAETRTG